MSQVSNMVHSLRVESKMELRNDSGFNLQANHFSKERNYQQEILGSRKKNNFLEEGANKRTLKTIFYLRFYKSGIWRHAGFGFRWISKSNLL